MKPKVTLRDLFWLVLVVGLALGWWLDRRALKQNALLWINAMGGAQADYEHEVKSILEEMGEDVNRRFYELVLERAQKRRQEMEKEEDEARSREPIWPRPIASVAFKNVSNVEIKNVRLLLASGKKAQWGSVSPGGGEPKISWAVSSQRPRLDKTATVEWAVEGKEQRASVNCEHILDHARLVLEFRQDGEDVVVTLREEPPE